MVGGNFGTSNTYKLILKYEKMYINGVIVILRVARSGTSVSRYIDGEVISVLLHILVIILNLRLSELLE